MGGKDTNHTNHSAPEALRSPRKTKVAGGWANDEERSEARALKPGRPSCEIKWQLVSGGLRSLYVYTTISKLIIGINIKREQSYIEDLLRGGLTGLLLLAGTC